MHDSHFPRTKVGTELETCDLQLVKEQEVCSLAIIGIACRLALVSARAWSRQFFNINHCMDSYHLSYSVMTIAN